MLFGAALTAIGFFARSHIAFSTLENAAKIAPLGTAVIALVAAIIALRGMYTQRDTARRRATIDFFFKTEMDDTVISAYYDFKDLAPQIPAIISRPTLSNRDSDYRKLRKWLDLCELLAAGVNLDAFSNHIALNFWGAVLPETCREADLFIKHVRRTPSLGGADTFIKMTQLCEEWEGKGI